MMTEAGFAPDVLHTSLQVRAIRTANIALDGIDRLWVPVRRSWRLNERHYGELTGANKAETTAKYGEEQGQDLAAQLRRATAGDHRGQPLQPERRRALRGPAPRTGAAVGVPLRRRGPDAPLLVRLDRPGPGERPPCAGRRSRQLAARALVKHLDGISDDEITELNIPTGVPLLYELDDSFHPADTKTVEERYLLDAETVRARAEAVAKQASGG